ncbi:MAG: helix-turn-helix transcriptional regulator [Kiritimatiellia bacterium]
MPKVLNTPIANAYKQCGITAEQVAGELGLSISYVYEIAAGKKVPSLQVAAQLSLLLNTPICKLFPQLFARPLDAEYAAPLGEFPVSSVA